MQDLDFTLINPNTNQPALRIYDVTSENPFNTLQRLDDFSLLYIQDGKGKIQVDFNEYSFTKNNLCSFSPYQPFKIETKEINAKVIHFHSDFFCIYKHQEEISCDGVLFNNIYEAPVIEIDKTTHLKIERLFNQMINEIQQEELAQYELLVSYLKIFLITASRLKTQQKKNKNSPGASAQTPFVLKKLKNYINENYKTNHSVSYYANMLAISPKALGRLTKTHFNKTLTDLITERIIIEAKRELFLTNKTIKEIAYNLGYEDEFYFSRFFKKKTKVSPQMYRKNVSLSTPISS